MCAFQESAAREARPIVTEVALRNGREPEAVTDYALLGCMARTSSHPRRGQTVRGPAQLPASSNKVAAMSSSRTVALVLALSIVGSALHAQRPNTREGFWIGFGLGTGSVGVECYSCTDERANGLSGYLRLGGTVSNGSILLGFESNGWVHSEYGVDEELGFGAFVLSWYPNVTGAFYLKFGAGVMSYAASDGFDRLTAKATSASIGAGYDIRVGTNFSLTPYINAFGTSPASFRINGLAAPVGEQIRANLVQIGLGLNWH